MRVAFLTKYPPDQGGTAAQAAVLIHGLAQKGVLIDVFHVSDKPGLKHPYLNHPGIRKIRITASQSELKLASENLVNKLALRVLKEHQKKPYDLIDAWYLFPFGVAACKASRMTGLPYILRHAGSDICRRIREEAFTFQGAEALKGSARVVTYGPYVKKLRSLGVKKEQIFLNIHESLDTSLFRPERIERKTDTVANLKILYLAKPEPEKGIFDLVRALKLVKADFCLFTNTSSEDVDKTLKDNLSCQYQQIPYQPFYKIPGLMADAALVVCLERDYPVQNHHPRVAREAMAMKKPVIISRDLSGIWPYKEAATAGALLVAEPRAEKALAEMISELLCNSKKRCLLGELAYTFSRKIEDFSAYCQSTLQLYSSLVN